MDLFEHLWVVDRLERLGISRYFEQEIQHCLDYVSRYWTAEGISWARNSHVKDVDDTAMAFRLLRTHGYDVSPAVFDNFEKDGEFFCFVGQSTQAVTGMYNLNRASQVRFPGEDVLRRAGKFSYEFLREREAKGTIRDKWIIAKDLPGEVSKNLSDMIKFSLIYMQKQCTRTLYYLVFCGRNYIMWIYNGYDDLGAIHVGLSLVCKPASCRSKGLSGSIRW